MFAVTIRAEDQETDLLLAELQDLGTSGVREECGVLIAYFATERDARLCCAAYQDREPLLTREDSLDYSANWQHEWQPFAVGGRFYLAPPWDTSMTPEGRIRLTMQPGNVFGSGDHPTTQLCLELLEFAINPGDRVLDVGTGTGILAIASAHLHARFAAACDTSPEAIQIAGNQSTISLWHGTTDACRSSAFTAVLANLPTGALIDILPEIHRVLVRHGRLIASGFFEEQLEEVRSALTARGFEIAELRERGDWAALSAIKRR
ncbi:MAG: 50S ribosomal protein L11 methyltransferase [Bryobacterales bacterium]|nr:50S ribosomal protein L11 methyltransferase [Bryobacterales bacterium]